MKKYIVRLSQQERKSLRHLIRSGKGAARTFTRAHILLKADVGEGGTGWNDQKISEAFDVTVQTVERVPWRLYSYSIRPHRPGLARISPRGRDSTCIPLFSSTHKTGSRAGAPT